MKLIRVNNATSKKEERATQIHLEKGLKFLKLRVIKEAAVSVLENQITGLIKTFSCMGRNKEEKNIC